LEGFTILAAKFYRLITLLNFTETLSERQVAKGKKYYEDGVVDSLTEVEPQSWEAEVIGTEVYVLY
jgi:uncharacterized Zn finger protein